MSMSHRNKIRRPLIKEHRRQCLDRAIGLLLAGQVLPEYVQERASKYKEVSHASAKRRQNF